MEIKIQSTTDIIQDYCLRLWKFMPIRIQQVNGAKEEATTYKISV
jgi:hypothetical protein